MKHIQCIGRLILLPALCLTLAACGGTSATAIRLRKAEGTVGVRDGAGQAVQPMENLGLYSGYGVDTAVESYAWIDLDQVKLTKLDQNSEVEIRKEDKRLTVEVKSGSLFFHVTEPLADDEAMDIRTSTIAAGIRGTCGWVEVLDEAHMTLCLLEGTVECSAGEETITVNAGERAEIAVVDGQGSARISALREQDIPSFAAGELDQELLDQAAEAMEEAQERYPVSRFKSRSVYVDESRLSSELKETIRQIYNAASVEDWDTAERLLVSTWDMEGGIPMEEETEGILGNMFYTEFEEYRISFSCSLGKQAEGYWSQVILEVRPESGTGIYLECQAMNLADSSSRNVMANYEYGHTIGQCENYSWNGAFRYSCTNDFYSSTGFCRGGQSMSGAALNGLLEGEIIRTEDGWPMTFQFADGNNDPYNPTNPWRYTCWNTMVNTENNVDNWLWND